jgi:hypothetical protein
MRNIQPPTASLLVEYRVLFQCHQSTRLDLGQAPTSGGPLSSIAYRVVALGIYYSSRCLGYPMCFVVRIHAWPPPGLFTSVADYEPYLSN